MDWRSIPDTRQRKLAELYVETTHDMATCAVLAGYSGNNAKQIANNTLRRLRLKGYDIPFRTVQAGGVKPGPEAGIDGLRRVMLQCADKLEGPPANWETALVAKRLREAAEA